MSARHAAEGTTADSAAPERSDAELVAAVAAGDAEAYAALWDRHAAAARRLAAQLTQPSNVDDLVSEAFARVLRAIRAGGGPESAFRTYLFNTMRRFNIDTGRSYQQRISLSSDDYVFDLEPAQSASEIYSIDDEHSAAWRAWESLPEDARVLLWHLVIEEESPARVGSLLGVSANGVSSRAVRAKERLRQAFLVQHLARAENPACRASRAKLGGYVRDALGARDRAAVKAHLEQCEHCAAAVVELRDVNGALRLVIAPILLGGAGIAARYLATAKHAAVAAAAGGTAGGGKAAGAAWFGRLAQHGKSGAQVAAAVVAAAVAATALALGLTSGNGTSHPRQASLNAQAAHRRAGQARPGSQAPPAIQAPPAQPPPTAPSTPPTHTASHAPAPTTSHRQAGPSRAAPPNKRATPAHRHQPTRADTPARSQPRTAPSQSPSKSPQPRPSTTQREPGQPPSTQAGPAASPLDLCKLLVDWPGLRSLTCDVIPVLSGTAEDS